VYAERGITQKRIGYVFDLIYMLNGALLLFQMYRYFDWHFLNLKNPGIFAVFLGLLGSLMLLRVLTMMMIGYVFDRSELFRSFLFHFYIYSKVTGILLIPFIISIPYTREPLTEFLIYGSLLVVGVVSLLRILRVLVFISKNVLLYFYLILYLCTVEILPIAVIIKLMISLT
jgi:hypothetical protein